VRFEALVRDPDLVTRRLCAALGVDFVEQMTRPYQEPAGSRMTDGLYPGTRMLGDVRFASHSAIDPSRATPHSRDGAPRLGAPALSLARRFGYEQAHTGGERVVAQGALGG
jgi:hypothetical protein